MAWELLRLLPPAARDSAAAAVLKLGDPGHDLAGRAYAALEEGIRNQDWFRQLFKVIFLFIFLFIAPIAARSGEKSHPSITLVTPETNFEIFISVVVGE